ncbi:MAG: RNA-binding S4 domain-containing protein [Xanthomonadales bacterium]|nr:RNA-binding S4 domain-containing protein [Xanthomonadales bacterium]
MPEGVRIDRWLWSCRLFKTRGLAKKAIDGGKVDLNGHRAKPSRLVQVGDRISITREHFSLEVNVTGLAEKRLGAALAAGLYQETAESAAAREDALEQRRLRRQDSTRPERRPDKRSRRRLRDLKGR